MIKIKKNLYKKAIKSLKLIFISLIVGVIGGVVGSGFHIAVDFATETREINKWIIYLLPVGGIVIYFIYSLFKKCGRLDTNRVFEAVKGKENVPLVMLPLIFIATFITHLLGGSAGREGAALQLGGSIGYNVGKLSGFDKGERKVAVMSGMSAVFAALFGTPLTAAVFSAEVVCVGAFQYKALIMCVLSSLCAYFFAVSFGITGVHYSVAEVNGTDISIVLKVMLIAALCAFVGVVFIKCIKCAEKYMKKLFPNGYIRAIIGSFVIIGLVLVTGTYDYNGAGMNIIQDAMNGSVKYEAFILKIIFTSVTIAAGFKGGEIVPTFFIGSTFGCMMASILGINTGFGAAIGFTALFCSVVNCPLASVILFAEVFGGQNILLAGLCCAISFVLSGKHSLYDSQEFKLGAI